jgi:hypothetical protein
MELRRASRGTSRSRNFTVLTFGYEGRTFDMLEELTLADSDRVLKACKSMGLDSKIVIDESAAMLHDIDKRGWFVNPLKPDRDDSSPTKK